MTIQGARLASRPCLRTGTQPSTQRSLIALAIPGVPIVAPGADLAQLMAEAIDAAGCSLIAGDILVVAQKIVSKAEARHVDLASVQPGEQALRLAREVGKDARLIEVILSESTRVVRHRAGVLIVEHRLGFIVANAGVDQSNVDPTVASEPVLLLPEDPDGSAEQLRSYLAARFGCDIAVVISDSFGRPWRLGTTGVALGAAGLPALMDLRGQPDLFNRALRVTEIGFADEIAAAASLLMGQGNEGCPVVLIRGLSWSGAANPASTLVRKPDEDLFR
jgi:coenzyme F420-0:L-glutamate ligase / coenzyme F420-1:gamma-L-glutamate ligase